MSTALDFKQIKSESTWSNAENEGYSLDMVKTGDSSKVVTENYTAEKKHNYEYEDEEKVDEVTNDGENEIPLETHYYEGIRLVLVQVALNLILFIAALDIVIVTSAIEKISEEFHDYSKSAWIITGFSLPNAVCCLIWSRISQKMGKKLSVLIAVVIFEIGSLVVALANSMNMLIGGRVIAGVAGSGVQTLMYVVGATLVPEEKRAMVFSLLSFSFTVSSVVGPFVGGAFTNAAGGGILSWRWCFYINLPIGFAALFLFWFIYDDYQFYFSNYNIFSKKYRANRALNNGNNKESFWIKYTKKSYYLKMFLELLVSFDMVGFLVSTFGYVLTLLSFTLSSSENYSWKSGIVIAFLIIGIILIVLSFLFEYYYYFKFVSFLEKYFMESNKKDDDKETVIFDFKKNAAPLFPKIAIDNHSIGFANAMAFFVLVPYGCQANYVIQYFQLIFNYSALKASINFIPFMISISLVCVICAVFIGKTGHLKPFIILGGIASVLGNALISTLDGKSNEAMKITYLIIGSSAFGFVAQSTLLSCQVHIKYEDDPVNFESNFVSVTALNYFTQTLGISIGSVISTMIFNLSVIDKAKQMDPPVVLTPNDIVSHIVSNYEGPTSKLSNVVAGSIHNVFYCSTAIACLSLILSFFCSNKRLATKKVISEREHQEEKEDDDNDIEVL